MTRRSIALELGGAGAFGQFRVDADRATHAGSAEAAIAGRILGEILLVVVLGEVERRRVDSFGGAGAEPPRGKRLGVAGARGLGRSALRRRKHVDAGAVLGADVVALPHALG